MERCKFLSKEGKCRKYDGREYECYSVTEERYKDPVDVVPLERVCERSSPWGNSFCYITEEQIEALRNGQAIYHDDGEYSTFIILKKGD